ncbi:class I SAM-dependent methyltransferase [Flavobacteriaceae bacterium AU392]|nr:class I SAM-dependent methyltransferase [Flavobacteriaceae bacterium]RKM85699.1 class I SAM-dependent methyltransferase [Flavobacteriaceae bacterium AU392]
MNINILNIEIQEFINNNLNSDISKLLLKKTFFEAISNHELIEQIEAKKKSKKKLPTWFNTKKIYYPNKLNIEQTSSEISAKYKASLISGNSIIDITGGLGIDSYYFSKQFKKVTHCEINTKLSHLVAYNYKQLEVSNIKTINQDGIQFLKTSNKNFDWIYIDPSRRHDRKGKVFYLKDCLPNVPDNLYALFKHSKNILIKASPMLDITVGINELQFVKTIHIIAIKNEVKELLFHLEEGFTKEIKIETVNINQHSSQKFDFTLNEEANAFSNYGDVINYLYEPNSAILKSGAFNLVSQKLKLKKLHKHSHLYTSKVLVNFPGRTFKINNAIPYDKKAILKAISNIKINISTRNFPENPQQLKAKFKFKDGGDIYVFFTTQGNKEKIVLICEKLK